MQYHTLGRTGLRVSAVGFGGAVVGIANYIEAWDPAGTAEQGSVVRTLERGLDLGYNYLDTAPGYGDGISETVFGRVVGRRRAECLVATKTGARDPEGIRHSVERSLRNLNTETLDVLQFHGGWYPPEDVEKILERGGLETYEALRSEGKVRFLGFTAEGPSGGVTRLIETGRFDVMQVRYNVMYQHTCDHVNSAGIVREAKARKMGVVTMRTLTSGTFQKLMRMAFPAELAHADLDRFCLNYVLSNPLIDVALAGMRRPEEAEANDRLVDDLSARIDLVELHARFV
jgi:uncharacterized protein